ncbi:FtsX-like permease family protein [Leptolyngbya sp. NK1-12]|uniref:FtsX-like permease family protein n=1 Tax=Leptolyngbya sp. NK1-12 TaxID=2547451 RepID=A0AA96WDY7_9CYAN|nr:ABC transporter permease [Elainella sp. C42_A2020_010]RNJ70763.1 MAG: FtsX-like permease family protein [Leptolyngbya sp. IPPAS B-1204]WNZ24457.1 FtsX-like permease family protein [Leptolyngbya sp. NK1-12]
MNIVESTKMAVKTLTANKLRSALTMLGIIIGNASVITMVGVGQGAQRYASEQFESLGPNVLFIIPGSEEAQNRTLDLPRTLTLEDAKAISSQVPTVSAVAPQLQTQQTLTYSNRRSTSLVMGTTPDFLTVRDFDVERGRFFSELDVQRNTQVVALGSDVARKFFGDAEPIGRQIRIRNLSFQVIGVMESKGAFLGNNQDDAVYIPITTMSSRITGNTSPYGTEVSFISVAARDEASVSAAEFQLRNLLRLRHKVTDEDDFTVRSQKDALEIVGNVTGALTLMLAAIAAISLFVGGIGIMNIMLVSVRERTHEIGLRKAIGASQQDILVQFMIEAIILSAIGGIIGTAIGAGGVMLVGATTPLKAGVSTAAIVLAVGVSGGIGLFFGVFPARQAAKLDPIVALRSA